MIQFFSTTILLFLTGIGIAQVDFNHYKSITSSGSMPADFSMDTRGKIQEALLKGQPESELSKKEFKTFVYGTNYAIDEILHSGLVNYGDPLSKYVEKVAKKLLVNEPELASKLRFYILKSNETNAFSTDQGILFVTTGLISQLTSEAQLALVLGHEIAHYVEKHTVESFKFENSRDRYDRTIVQMSNYSKNHELEADKIGLKYYYDAGYSNDEVLGTFDILLYSYLPFDEIEMPLTYWNTSQFFVPTNNFPDKKFPIKAIEDYDDKESSHPNIKNRKLKMEENLGAFANWGEAKFFFGEAEFDQMRDIARFESIRTDILNGELGNALYSIFLLEQKYPNSTFLKEKKAHCYYDLLTYKLNSTTGKVLKSKSELEGESATLHFFLKKLNKQALNTLSIRIIYDLRKDMPNNKVVDLIYNRTIKQLAYSKDFELDQFAKKSFSESYEEYLLKKAAKDSIPQDSIAKQGSKYDRIRKKKNVNYGDFDSSSFYLYGIGDIIQDSSFVQLYKQYKLQQSDEEVEESKYYALSNKEKQKYRQKKEEEKYALHTNEFILVQPMAVNFNKNGSINYDKSFDLEEKYADIIVEMAHEEGLKTYSIDQRTVAKDGTSAFNERTILFNFLNQISNDDAVDVFPLDYLELQEIKNNYGTNKAMFTIVETINNKQINPMVVILGTVFVFPAPYVYFIYLPTRVMNGNLTEMDFIMLDLDQGKIDFVIQEVFKEPTRKINLSAHLYHIFKQFKK